MLFKPLLLYRITINHYKHIITAYTLNGVHVLAFPAGYNNVTDISKDAEGFITELYNLNTIISTQISHYQTY